MNRPGAAVEVEEEEKDNELDPAAGEENTHDEPKPSGEEDPNAGGKGGNVGKDGDEGEGETGEEKGEENVEVDPRDAKLATLEAEIKALKEGAAKPKDVVEDKPIVYTEEQKAQIEQNMGGMPFDQVSAITRLVSRAIQNVVTQMEGRFGRSDKTQVLSDLSKEKDFADIQSYMPGVEEYLAKFDPSMHGKKEVLMDAYWYAKGRGLKKAVTKAINAGEKNRRIAGAARPAAPGGKTQVKGSGPKFKLTESEKSAYQISKHLFKSEEDYAKNLPRYKNAA